MGMGLQSCGIFRIDGRRLESTGIPNSRYDLYVRGKLYSSRWYGPDGRAVRNRNYTDHGNSKEHPVVPHDHPWDWNKEPPRQSNWEYPDENFY